LRSENLFLKGQLAEKEGQLCAAREEADVIIAMCIDDALGSKVPYEMAMNAARMIKVRLFKNTSPCPHAEEAERLKEAVVVLWKEHGGHCPLCGATPHSRHCEIRGIRL